MIEGISAITLATHDMRRAIRFYRVLGFAMLYGGEDVGEPERSVTSRAALTSKDLAAELAPSDRLLIPEPVGGRRAQRERRPFSRAAKSGASR